MQRLIEAAFPHCTPNGCMQMENSTCLIIYDDDATRRSCIHKSNDPLDYPKFTINNPNSKQLRFLAIDHCIFFDGDGGKCDFAVFDDGKFVFVEIKKGGGSDRNRSEKKKDAVGQLKSTLDKFSRASVDFGRYRVMACMSVGYFNQSPAAAAADLDLLVEFINDYDTELIEGNEIGF